MNKDLDKVAALAETSHLDPFDGKAVVRTSIAVTNAGDGLSASMAVAPRQLHHEEEVLLVLRTTVSKVGFVPLSKDTPDLLTRNHTLRASSAVILTAAQGAQVEQYLAAEEERIRKAIEHAQGIFDLDDAAKENTTPDEGEGTPEDPDDPVDPTDEDDTSPEEPTRIGARNLTVERRDDGWHVVDKDTGTSTDGPHTSRNKARDARERQVAS